MVHLREHHGDLFGEAMALQQTSGSCSGRGTTKHGVNNSTNGLTNGEQSQIVVTELFEASRKFHLTSPQVV